jgi:hypothetical protein
VERSHAHQADVDPSCTLEPIDMSSELEHDSFAQTEVDELECPEDVEDPPLLIAKVLESPIRLHRSVRSASSPPGLHHQPFERGQARTGSPEVVVSPPSMSLTAIVESAEWAPLIPILPIIEPASSEPSIAVSSISPMSPTESGGALQHIPNEISSPPPEQTVSAVD